MKIEELDVSIGTARREVKQPELTLGIDRPGGWEGLKDASGGLL